MQGLPAGRANGLLARVLTARVFRPAANERIRHMIGIEDKWVALAYLLCIASTVLCVVYGFVNWNRGDDTVEEDDVRWEQEDKKVEEKL